MSFVAKMWKRAIPTLPRAKIQPEFLHKQRTAGFPKLRVVGSPWRPWALPCGLFGWHGLQQRQSFLPLALAQRKRAAPLIHMATALNSSQLPMLRCVEVLGSWGSIGNDPSIVVITGSLPSIIDLLFSYCLYQKNVITFIDLLCLLLPPTSTG